jgi:hypothetical protein
VKCATKLLNPRNRKRGRGERESKTVNVPLKHSKNAADQFHTGQAQRGTARNHNRKQAQQLWQASLIAPYAAAFIIISLLLNTVLLKVIIAQ